MATAPGAQDLGPRHAEGAFLSFEHGPCGDGPVEAGPPGARLELGLGVEEPGAAAGTAEDPSAVDVEEVARPRRFGAGPAEHGVALRRELSLPLLVGLGDLERRLCAPGLA